MAREKVVDESVPIFLLERAGSRTEAARDPGVRARLAGRVDGHVMLDRFLPIGVVVRSFRKVGRRGREMRHTVVERWRRGLVGMV